MSSLNQMISMLNENITLMVGGRELEDFKTNETAVEQVKLRRCEKATKLEKNLPPVLTKQLFLLSSVKTSGRFFQIFVAFSEKLDFT